MRIPLQFFEAAWQVLRSGARPLLAYGILWRLFLFLVFGPLSVATLNALVQQSGQSAITNTGLVSFTLSPLGMATLLLGVVFSFLLTSVELSGFLFILQRLFCGRTITVWQALSMTGGRLPALLLTVLWQVLLGLLAVVPFLAIAGLTWWLLLSGSDINFYLARRPPEFIVAASVGAVLLIGLLFVLGLLYIRWFFAVPITLFGGTAGRDALRASARLGRGHRLRILGSVAAWQVLRFAVATVALFGLDYLNLSLLRTEAPQGDFMVRTLTCLALDGVVLLLLSIADSVGFALLVAVLYENLPGPGWNVEAPASLVAASPLPPFARALRFGALACLILLGASALGHAVLLADRFAGHKPVGVTAHRAGALKAPENTLAALRQAIADGADSAEIDVQETADGIVVVLHDKDLRRLTGQARGIWETPYDEMKSLDAGSWFGEAFRHERIATLEEFIEAARGRIKLNIELKYNGHDKQLAERVVELLRKHDFLNQVVITSLEYRGLEEIRRLEPKLRTGYIVSASVGDLTQLDVDFLSVRDGLVTPALRSRASQHGWELHVWTVNERNQLEAALDAGGDNLITDDVELARRVLREREAMPVAELVLRRLHLWMRSGHRFLSAVRG